jgi:hypothetical protein
MLDLAYLSYAHKLRRPQHLSVHRYAILTWAIQLIDDNQNDQGTYKPSEFSIRWFLCAQVWQQFFAGINYAVYLLQPSNGAFVSGSSTAANAAGNAISAGVSVYYKKVTEG